ncbi:MAG: MFS transporter [Candidatus Eremiobacter antarcticus]|nr:MFS transporter [Candidatus Eremiobacteraeota bacterium]MBC5808736.1 MFS transporter [Candidatus Eremiobacteraeota bacterium]PZR62209.1 MAG: MFS transporter [Candidatus Eremiobacter sp. RRmetagenome_bin22]
MNRTAQATFKTIVAARAVRTFGFGLLSVALALYLADRGFSPFAVGALLTVALLAGAAFLAASARLVGRFGRRGALLVGSGAMCVAGLMLAMPGGWITVVVACLLGTLSAGAQEVGPFSGIEQHAIAEIVPQHRLAHKLAVYNLVGAFALALGALAAAVIPTYLIPWAYAGCGLALIAVYVSLAEPSSLDYSKPIAAGQNRFGPTERLALLFGVDALAGGFVVQSFLAYWLHLRFGSDQRVLGLVLFGANTLAAFSYPVAAWLSARIGLLRTMVFTHLPSNILLCIVPLMPTFRGAVTVLLARFALSQMDVPTRQAFAMTAVPLEQRARAAALTNAVRPTATAITPLFAGLAVQSALSGLPFFLAGGLKIVYDVILYFGFQRMKPWERRGRG